MGPTSRGYKHRCIDQAQTKPEEQGPLNGLDVQEDLTYTEHPVKILETSERVTRNKRIKMCRVQWSHHSEAEATWEREDELRKTYPDLFASQPS